MASNRNIRPVIVTCLLSAALLLGGCSPPLPKTLLLPSDGMMYKTHLSIDRMQVVTAFPLTTKR